ncbi:hypothetical protein Tco_1124784 [Tanacetum coccineum]|uniref:Retrovirus-related Pol polyprotein from transposon TNT 1-94-like beta-barrel domain-containing protein n=1 Tax=Tanacetum coccineum TaxID=301880 RepID=A0ABQ5JB55_9ASTR
MVYQLTKFHVQRVDMVINPPWNLPFLGAKGLTSPEQTATGKGISNPLMAVMVCQKSYGIQLTNVSSTERVNILGSDKNRLKLYDLMYIIVNVADMKNRENELGWDDSAFSVSTTNSEDVEGRPYFNRFDKTDSMKAVPLLLIGDYTSLSDHIDLDESHMSYGTKSSTSGDSNSVSNDFVSCDNSDKSTKVNSNNFASSDSSVKSLEPNYLHLIKDCNYYETQYANNSDGVGNPQRKPTWDNASRVTQSNHFVPQAVPLRSGKVSISAARPNQVSTGRPKPVPTGRPKPVSTGRPKPVPTDKPKVPEPVPTGRQNRPFPVPSGRRYSPSVTSGWWKSTAKPMSHLNRPTSSYFQTYTPYVPQMYYNHMQYGGVRWATAVKPSAGCSWKTHRKGLYWENSYTDAEDEGIFDSGCSRSMTGNMDRLDDFQEFQGGKVTLGSGEGRITSKGTIRTPTLDFENVYYVKELQQFNLFSISQIYDKKNRVLFIDTDCLVLSKDFKLLDDSMVLLRVPRKHNLYTINLNNLSPKGKLACLVAKASVDESVK